MLGEHFAAIVSLVNLTVTLFGGFMFLMSVKARQAVQDVLLERLSDDIATLNRIVEALRRGDGWIKAPLNREVDREY